MDNITKQEIKGKITEKIKKEISPILKTYNLSDKTTDKIISGVLIWASFVIDHEIE